MQFMSRYENMCYVVRPGRFVMMADGTKEPSSEPAIRANFVGPSHIFDSVAAQRMHGWDDETRLRVERYLLTHRDFGQSGTGGMGGLYLAPGEVVPPEHAGLVATEIVQAAAEGPDVAGDKVCAYVWTNAASEVEQCTREAAGDSDYCDQHLADAEALEIASAS